MAQLARVVGLWGAVWLGLGSILGTGVFVSLGIAAGVVGPGVVLAVGLAALVATFNGLSSAQLAAAHPVSGGTYEYGHKFIHPTAGFVAGSMFLLAKSASAATAALGCAGYLLHVAGFDATGAGRVGLAVGVVAAITALVATGMRRSNTANIVLVSLTIGALATFVFTAFSSVDASSWTAKFDLGEWKSTDLLEATALMFVAYTGYGRIATLGEEVREPAQTIPRAIITTLVVSMVLYVSVSAAAVAAVGADVFASSTASVAAPLEVVMRVTGHPVAATIVAVGAVGAMAGVLLNLVLGLSRVLLAMARRKEAPRPFAHVTESGSPTHAVVAIGLLVAGLALLGDVRTTWSFSAFTVLVYYGLTNLAALRLPPEHRRFPRAISYAGLASCFGLAFFVDWQIWAIGSVLVVAAAATSLMFRSRR